MYAYTLRACETNNAFMLIALNQEFNFGAVRLQKLIAKYNEVSMMYRDHIRDGFTDEECIQIVKNALVDIGLEPSQVFSKIERDEFSKFKREKRKFAKKQRADILGSRKSRGEYESIQSGNQLTGAENRLMTAQQEILRDKLRRGSDIFKKH